MTQIWKALGLLSEENFNQTQLGVDKFFIPCDGGRIPHKIASKFASFTADQWKNRVLIYSSIILKAVIPDDH